MPLSVLCSSCGNRIELADDFARRKVRCPECGVMCEVEGAAKSEPRRSEMPAQDAEELARQLWSEPDDKPPPKPSLARRANVSPTRQRGVEEPAPEPPPPPEEPEPERQGYAVTWTEEDEDPSPYDVAGGLPAKCPQCHRDLERGSALCVACGFDLRGGKKHEQKFDRLERSWEQGAPLEVRRKLFVAGVAASFVLSLGTAILVGPWYLSIGPWLGFVGMTSFLLGTFPRHDLARDRRGNTRLTRTWRVCFVVRPTETIDLRNYDGVVTGRSVDAGCYEWFILLTLLPFFIVPGVLWWYYVIHMDKFHAGLTHSHGYPEVILYRGNSQEKAEEVAVLLRDTARLRYERG